MLELLKEFILKPLGNKIKRIVAKKQRIEAGKPISKRQLKR